MSENGTLHKVLRPTLLAVEFVPLKANFYETIVPDVQ